MVWKVSLALLFTFVLNLYATYLFFQDINYRFDDIQSEKLVSDADFERQLNSVRIDLDNLTGRVSNNEDIIEVFIQP